MDRFLKIQNFQTSLSAFKEWMQNKHSINIETISNLDVKKLLFETMRDVKNEYINDTNVDIKDLNNIALNRLQKIYMDKINLRDASAFGSRPLIQNHVPLPENTSKIQETKFDDLIKARTDLINNIPLPTPPTTDSLPPEDPIPVEIFNKMVSSYRNDINTVLPPLAQTDPKALYEPNQQQVGNIAAPIESMNDQEQVYFEDNRGGQENTIIEKTIVKTVVDHYIVINGYDRKWEDYKKRYEFRIDLPVQYKNISTIQFTRLIVPYDFNTSNTKMQPQLLLQTEQKMNIPYIMLSIDEIDSKYENKSVVCFVYENSFKCPNGRGYMVLKSAQNEINVYDQSLTYLSHVSLSLRKPSGMLLSNIQDNYTIVKVEYELYNQQFLKVVLNKYFDKSEFNVGDNVKIKGHNITMPSTADPSCTKPSNYTDLNSYINREYGHEIIFLGDTNEHGYYKTFFIPAPGEFNPDLGRVFVEKNIVDALKTFNESNSVPLDVKIINMSVQPVLYFTLSVESGKVFKANF